MSNRKPKKCLICETEYTPRATTQKVCSTGCAIQLTRKLNKKKKERAERKELRERKEKLKSRSVHLKEAQREFNRFIRLRDKDRPCISCGTKNPNIVYAAGHYRSVGANPELRFEELNVHKQCNFHCNEMKSGNITEYRKGLIERIGQDNVDWLEGPHQARNYTNDEIKEIKRYYREKCKDLENDE